MKNSAQTQKSLLNMASSDSQIDKPQRGHPKRAELPDVNINTGAQSINTESFFKPLVTSPSASGLLVSRMFRPFGQVTKNNLQNLVSSNPESYSCLKALCATNTQPSSDLAVPTITFTHADFSLPQSRQRHKIRAAPSNTLSRTSRVKLASRFGLTQSRTRSF